MKFIVDSLPYYNEDCPFNNDMCNSTIKDCPRYWSKYFISNECYDKNPRECEWLIEYGKVKDNDN